MVSPISLLQDFSYQENLSLVSSQEIAERSQKLISLFKGMLPISNATIDYQNNHSRLWALNNKTFLGTVSHPDGKITCISMVKSKNLCLYRR